MDDDPTASFHDYEGGVHTYDGHAGTDIHLFNFPHMDRGCRIRAAAPGTVAFISNPSPFDRNCDSNYWPDGGNWVWLAYGDGTYHSYYHLRANSMTVQLGDVVQTGQMIGLIGSSGYSTGPHLHFETGDYFNNNSYTARDPWNGTNNPLPSLWNDPRDYQGDVPLWVADQGVFTEDEVRGSVFNTNYCDVVQRINQPVVLSANQARLCMWFQIQGREGDSVLVEGVLSRQVTFQVGPANVYGPRFWPRAARSYLVGSTQRDTLRRWPFSGPVSYSLLNAPAFVSLTNDSILEIGPSSTQPTRSLFFQAVMTDGAARRDTAWFHRVDMSKPPDPPVDVPLSPPSSRRASLAQNAPNPFSRGTRIHFEVPHRSLVKLEIYDLAGRAVRTLESGVREPGDYDLLWEGRDAAGARVTRGVYFYRLSCGVEHQTRRLVRLD